MAQEYDFSLLLASQYSGGPLAWNEQVLLNANGAVLNEIEITKDKARSFKVAKSEVISIALSPCRKFLAIIEGKEFSGNRADKKVTRIAFTNILSLLKSK